MELTQLNEDQRKAYSIIFNWLKDTTNQCCLLEGKPGTGKTFLLKHVISQYKRKTVFTAPTNKATKVLSEMLTSTDYNPTCMTIFKLLGLRLVKNGEVAELEDKDHKPDLNLINLVVLDEAGMCNIHLVNRIKLELKNHPNLKLLVIMDRYQLPPVKENYSDIITLFDGTDNPQILLTKVERHDGNILRLVNNIRDQIDRPYKPNFNFLADYTLKPDIQDVQVMSQLDMAKHAIAYVKQNKTFDGCKIIAWRNKTVDLMNIKIREQLYPKTYKQNYWEVGDKIVMTAPAIDFDTDDVIANTDDTGTIIDIDYIGHPMIDYDAAKLTVTMDDTNNVIHLYAIAPYDKVQWTNHLSLQFKRATHKEIRWKDYWDLHDSVHYVKHNYAITAHRAQGSTYPIVYVNFNDIMQNSDRLEALKCLFVATSRASKQLIIGK